MSTLLMPLLICIARICDVTLGTIRIIYTSKGLKVLASFLGFFEISIWLFAIGQIMNNLTNWKNYIAYALGFSIGIFIGIYIEEKLSVGILMLRIVTKEGAPDLVNRLRNAGYGTTTIDAQGVYGPVDVIFTIIQRKELKRVTKIIRRSNPDAVYAVEEVRHVNKSPFPVEPTGRGNVLQLFRFFRKGK